MRIDYEIAKCIGFIGAQTPIGFAADGTCFFVRIDEETEAFTYIVTARHLVRPIKFGKETESLNGIVRIRVSRKTKDPLLLETIRSSWVPHPNRHVDVCVRPFSKAEFDSEDELDFHTLIVNDGVNTILFSDFQAERFGPITMGDEIFIPSLFPGHVGENRNIPVVRVGNIAAPPLEVIRVGSPTVPAYLIETKSLGGISGAPVFLHLQPGMRSNAPLSTKSEKGDYSVPYALIGMVLGLHSGQYASDFIQTDTAEAIVNRDTDFNAGLSVVLPIESVLELLRSDDMTSARKASLKAVERQSGYRPASSRPYPPISEIAGAPKLETDENPDHLEDFTRLVSAASKRKPKGDRT
jgi:hypothetical protein